MMANLDALCSLHKLSVPKVVKASGLDEALVKARVTQLKKYKKQLAKLLKLPKVEQKTEEWYKMRQNMITASDFAQALGDGKFGTVKQFYQKKCEPITTDDAANSKTNPFFKWGNMFEPVAIDVYSHMNNVVVHNFGLLQHPKNDFFGASPDGISDVGIMVEIKCPRKRKIDGDVPKQYYYQIQGQLDVCCLEECDYFECEFVELDTFEDYINIIDHCQYYGVIVEVTDNVYEYSPLCLSKQDITEWCGKYNDGAGKMHYWVLDKHNQKRVVRDDAFVKEKLGQLKVVWEKILHYRSNRTAYEIDVLNEIKIETQRLDGGVGSKSAPKLSGWAFIDDGE
jgi:putative phage-type endonuclease